MVKAGGFDGSGGDSGLVIVFFLREEGKHCTQFGSNSYNFLWVTENNGGLRDTNFWLPGAQCLPGHTAASKQQYLVIKQIKTKLRITGV